MNIKRKLAEGVAGWLMFESHSNRGRLFGEKYLTAPIGHILSGIYGTGVLAEMNHPILNMYKTWPGRPPQIDFGILAKDKYTVAVESKWIGKTQVGVGEIIWDLIRLELLHYAYATTCFFILGGQKKKLIELFASDRFQEPRENGRTRPVLRLLKNVKKLSIRIDSPPPKRAELIKGRISQYQNVSMPTGIVTGYPEFYPLTCKSSDYQVFIWEVRSYKSKPRFFPKNSNYYRT
jgi:hypothetical protein